MFKPQRFLPNRQGTLIERFGRRVVSLSEVEHRETVEAGTQAGVLRSEMFRLPDGG